MQLKKIVVFLQNFFILINKNMIIKTEKKKSLTQNLCSIL